MKNQVPYNSAILRHFWSIKKNYHTYYIAIKLKKKKDAMVAGLCGDWINKKCHRNMMNVPKGIGLAKNTFGESY